MLLSTPYVLSGAATHVAGSLHEWPRMQNAAVVSRTRVLHEIIVFSNRVDADYGPAHREIQAFHERGS